MEERKRGGGEGGARMDVRRVTSVRLRCAEAHVWCGDIAQLAEGVSGFEACLGGLDSVGTGVALGLI